MADGSTRVVYAALAGNLLVTASKFVAAWLSGSSAMLTEAFHSSADSINQVLLLIGTKRSRAAPDATHAFGYGMEIYFWSFVVAVMVLLAGGAASLYEGVVHLRHPGAVDSPVVALVVLGVSAIFEGSSFAVGFREYKRIVCGRKVDGRDVGLWRFIVMSKDPNLYESLLEDFAAIVGLGIAALGVVGNAYFGLLWADGAASIAIGILLVADSFVIVSATRSLIAGEAASPLLLDAMNAALDTDDQRLDIADMKTLQFGPRTVLVLVTIRAGGDGAMSVFRADFDALAARLRRVDERIVHVLLRFA